MRCCSAASKRIVTLPCIYEITWCYLLPEGKMWLLLLRNLLYSGRPQYTPTGCSSSTFTPVGMGDWLCHLLRESNPEISRMDTLVPVLLRRTNNAKTFFTCIMCCLRIKAGIHSRIRHLEAVAVMQQTSVWRISISKRHMHINMLLCAARVYTWHRYRYIYIYISFL